MTEDYRAINLANWNSRVAFHERGYGLDRYRADPEHLSDVVRFDLPRLGDVTDLDVVHLQCHIGTDTLSLARCGARMTGLDFSAPALEVARRLAADCGADVEYVEAELYGAVEALGRERFDLVYTGIGALNWLPDIRRWARVVSALLRPGGRLFVREAHPMLGTLAQPRADGLVVVEYPYFETAAGTRVVDTKTYVDHEGELASPAAVEFTLGSGRSSPPSRTPGWRSRRSTSTTRCRGTSSRARRCRTPPASTGCASVPSGSPRATRCAR